MTLNHTTADPLSAAEDAEYQRQQDSTDLLAVMLRILLRNGHTLAVATADDQAPTIYRLGHMREFTDIPVIEFDNGEYRYLTGSGDGAPCDDYGLTARDHALLAAVKCGHPLTVAPGDREVSFAATPRGQRLARRRAASRKAA